MARNLITLTLLASMIFLVACEESGEGVYASGTVEAREVLMSAKVAGEVTALHVKRSQMLKKGDLMVEIDPEAYRLQGKQAQAALGAARQQYEKAKKGLREEEIDRARQAVEAARAQYELTEDTLQRREKLLEKEAISQQDYDVTLSKYKSAKANLEAAQKQYELARKGAREEDIEAAREQVERAKAAAGLAALQESYSNVKSPGELTVSEIFVEEGELAGQGTALVLLQDLSDFYIDVYVPIEQLRKVSPGDRVKVEVTGFPGRTFEGEVERIKPRAEFTPENVTTEEGRSHLVFKMRVNITEGAEDLKPGLPADAWIIPGAADETGNDDG